MTNEPRQEKLIKREITRFLRNSDVLTTTQRAVTRVTDDTYTAVGGETTVLINRPSVKNIKDVVIDAASQVEYVDFTYDTNYVESSIVKTQITFTNPLSAGEVVGYTYDYGAERIFYTWDDHTLDQTKYPRINIDVEINGEPAGIGNVHQANVKVVVGVYALNSTEDIMHSARVAIMGNFNGFHYIKAITKGLSLPELPLDSSSQGEFIFIKTQDFLSEFNYERWT